MPQIEDKSIFLIRNVRNSFAAISVFCLASGFYTLRVDLETHVPDADLTNVTHILKQNTKKSEDQKEQSGVAETSKDTPNGIVISSPATNKKEDEFVTLPNIPAPAEKRETDEKKTKPVQERTEGCQERGDCWKLIINRR